MQGGHIYCRLDGGGPVRTDLTVIQIGLNTTDVAATARLYCELFGFANAGGHLIWGEPMRIQGLDPDARGLMWWLVGRQRFFQLEIFHHTRPAQRPLPDEWQPSDHGWTRFGVEVSRFDDAMATLGRWGIVLTGQCQDNSGIRRAAFRDPFVGCVVELIEATTPRVSGHALDPVVRYATSSVSDLTSARRFYGDVLGFGIDPLTGLHEPAHETLWGLTDARRDGFVVDSGTTKLEIVRYETPAGRPRQADYRTTDQGIVNIALGSRETMAIEHVVDRLRDEGCRLTPVVRFGDALGTYLLDPEREMELIALPEALDAHWGFEPIASFIGA
jgi:catechol 2,3-dioxygenase-like lactoylglutathione lyase family enzyme